MEPFKFPESNYLLPAHPKDKEAGTVMDMHVWTNNTEVISAWKMTKEEVQEFLKTGIVYVRMPIGPAGIAPIYLSPDSPFVQPEENITPSGIVLQ